MRRAKVASRQASDNMAAPFDEMFEGGEPEHQDAPKRAGLVLGERLTAAQFAAKFVGKTGTEGMPPVMFQHVDEQRNVSIETMEHVLRGDKK